MAFYEYIACAIICAFPFILIYCIICGVSNAYKNVGKDDVKTNDVVEVENGNDFV